MPLFNPRTPSWHEHFQWSVDAPFEIIGKTPCGRATVQRLALNDSDIAGTMTMTPRAKSQNLTSRVISLATSSPAVVD